MPNQGLSAYELEREANIARNKQIFASLGLGKAVEGLSKSMKKKGKEKASVKE